MSHLLCGTFIHLTDKIKGLHMVVFQKCIGKIIPVRKTAFGCQCFYRIVSPLFTFSQPIGDIRNTFLLDIGIEKASAVFLKEDRQIDTVRIELRRQLVKRHPLFQKEILLLHHFKFCQYCDSHRIRNFRLVFEFRLYSY